MDARTRLAALGRDSQRRLFSALRLRAGEGKRTALACAYHLGFVASVVLLKSASNALVVARYQAQALPPLYIASALATGLVAWIAVLVQRRGSRKLPRRGLIGASIVLGGLTVAAENGLTWAILGLYLFGEAFATLVSIRFWGGVSELFDPRESRRIFGILGGAGMAGAILAGSLAQLFGSKLGAIGLLPMAMALLLATASVGQALYRWVRFDPKADSIDLPGEDLARRARAYLGRNPLARGMAALMLLLASLTALADYIFRARAGAVLGEGEMASLFGALNLWMGVIAILFQLGAAGRILERWGVFRYLTITPALTGVSAVGCFLVPGLGPAFALRLVESAGSLSLNPAAFQLLYGPMPDAIRAPLRSFIDGLVKKVGFALGGLLLFWAGRRFDEAALLGGLVAVVGLIVWVLRRARRAYLATIEERLSRAVGPGVLLLRSAEARAALERALQRDEPVRLLIALALLRDDPRFDAALHLPRLLAHPDARVRRAAVGLARSRGVAEVAEGLEALLGDEEVELAYEAALALGALAPERAREALRPFLAEPAHPLSGAAIAALLPREAGEGEATRALRARLAAPAPAAAARRETARALGKLGRSPFSGALARYLGDLDPSVRRAAALAAGEARDPALLPTLAGLLSDRAVRVQARKALAARGDEAVPMLARWLDEKSLPLSLRLEVPRVLRGIGTEAASHALLHSNIEDHAYLRYRIAVQLSKLHQEHPEVPVARGRLHEATVRRLNAYGYYLRVYRDLEAALPAGSPLVRALGDRLEQNLELVFRLLQIRFADMPLIGAWRAFARGGPRDRAYCIELLEHLLEPAFRETLVPLLEQYHRLPPAPGAAIDADPRRAPARMMELAVSDDVELAAIARQTARLTWPENPPVPPADEDDEMDAKIIERVFLFEGVSAFSEGDVDDLVALAQISRERHHRRGQILYREGDEAGALYVVIEGRVICTRGGREVLRVEAGDSFGQTSVLDGGRRPVTAVVASDEAHILALDREDLIALIADRPELLHGIVNAVTRHLRDVLDGVGAMSRDESRELAKSVG